MPTTSALAIPEQSSQDALVIASGVKELPQVRGLAELMVAAGRSAWR